MEAILQWGLEVVRFIQQMQNPLLTSFFFAVSGLGGAAAFFLVLPALFWCMDYKLGVRVAVVFSISAMANSFLKEFFAQPRPFNLDPGVGIGTASGFGLPSGHAQESLVFWGSLALGVRKRWFWAGASVLIVLVGCSRVYLGVHFPTDVLAGWAVGGILLWLYAMLWPAMENWILSRNTLMQVLLVLAVPPGLLLLHVSGVTVLQLGLLLGIGFGVLVRSLYLSFPTRCTPVRALLRYGIGMAMLVGLLGLLRGIYPARETAGFLVMSFFHSAVNGLWISLGAPWLFRLLKL